MEVYLDYAATSPVKSAVFKILEPYLKENFGNPSSIYRKGQISRKSIDEARVKIANFLNCDPQEIIFTSGGTEADNLAINGIIENFDKPHIITSMIEHHAVLNTCKYLEKTGQAEVTYLKPSRDGVIDVEDIKKAICENTILVSVMYVNNEIGTVQPIREIGKMIEKENKQRLENSVKRKIDNTKTLNSANYQPIYFHTDAVQASEYQEMNVQYLHVDLLSLSGHKIGAPKGIGALYVKKSIPFSAMMHGGEQEMGKRAGTENVAGIVALGKAVELIKKTKTKTKKLRDYFIDRVLKEIPAVHLNGSYEFRNPNNANFYFKYIEGESILLNLDLVGIAASSGSACASASLNPSNVLMAAYGDAERAHGSIRFTLGENTTKKEIDYTINKLKIIVEKLRKISPLTPLELRS